MPETTPEMLAMADRIAWSQWPNSLDHPERDDAREAAIAAIKETTELAARLADSGMHNIAHLATPERIATALRNGEHYHD